MKTECPACKEEVEVPDLNRGFTVGMGGNNYNAGDARMCPDCGNLFVPKGASKVDDNPKNVGMQISM